METEAVGDGRHGNQYEGAVANNCESVAELLGTEVHSQHSHAVWEK
jgi:hypothetical protein